jgi:polyferredoxin
MKAPWNKAKKRKRKKSGNVKPEFSKIIMAAVLLTYFVGVTVGTWAVARIIISLKELFDQSIIIGVLTAYFGFLAAPVGIAIGFYSFKSKAENLLKMRLSHPDAVESLDLENLQP